MVEGCKEVKPNKFLKRSCLQASQKDLRGEALTLLSRAAREKSTSGCVLRRYVGAGMIPAAIERNYPKCLLKAGWWHMSLFQPPARGTGINCAFSGG